MDVGRISGLMSHPEIAIHVANQKSANKVEPFAERLARLAPLGDMARKLRILLLEPLYPPSATWGSAKVEQGYLPPIGLVSVYNFLRHRGYQVDLIDTQFGDYDEKSLSANIAAHAYDVVGIPVLTSTADYAFATARLVRQALPGCAIVFGNIHASSQPELTFAQCPEADYIVKHEGEFTFDELLRYLAGEVTGPDDIAGIAFRREGRFVETPHRPFIADLDILPKGFYADLDIQRYVPHPTQYITLPNYPLVTQRGCPYPCTYCEASVILGKKMRFFSPERVLEELKILKYEKGARGIYFQDSTFTTNKKYVMRLLDLMVKENLGLLWSCNTRADRADDEICAAMHAAGCRQVVLGIESGNQESLDIVRKQTTVEIQTEGVLRIHRHRMNTICSYILGLPGETPEMAWRTVEYAKSLASRIAMFYLPVPYPGSELYQACLDDGGIRRPANWSDFLAIDFNNPVYINPKIGKEGMAEIYRRAFRSYYADPRVWMCNLRSLFWGIPVTSSLRGLRAFVSMFVTRRR